MSTCREIDALMMDWLYDELEPTQRAHFDSHLHSCADCQGEIAPLVAIRNTVRQLPAEEPPPALSAILLREAARLAPPPRGDEREARGFLAWLAQRFQPLVAHPAAAAVATLVLVVGITGMLYLRGEQPLVDPDIAVQSSGEARGRGMDTAAQPAAAMAEKPAPTGEPEPSLARPGAATPAEGFGESAGFEESADGDSTGGARRGFLDEAPRDRRRRTPEADSTAKLEAAGWNRTRRPARQKKDKKPPVTRAVTRTAALIDESAAPAERSAGLALGGLDDDSSADAVVGVRGTKPGRAGAAPRDDRREAEKQAAERRARAPRPTAPASTAPANAPTSAPARPDAPRPPAGSAGPGKAGKGSPDRWARGRQQVLSDAVRSKQCGRAARIANDILDRAPDYYRRNVAGSKELARCQSYVARERRRRRASRKAKAKAAEASEATASEAAE